MNKIVALKPDLPLLSQYGYAHTSRIWGNSITNTDSPSIAIETLNSIPGEVKEVIDVLKIICVSYGLKQLADTLIIICLDQADWYHTNLEGAYETYSHRLKVKELACLVTALNEGKVGKIELQLKKGAKVLARLTHPELLYELKSAFTKRLFSLEYSGGIITQDDNFALVDPLVRLSTLKIKSPYRLPNKLRTVFIAKVHEFLRNESHFKTSVGSFNNEQRRLIYELGSTLKLFPEEHKGSDSDYIEQIYRDNTKLFLRTAKGGRVNLN